MNEKDIKDFIKANLILQAEFQDSYSPSNDIVVSLIFKGDDVPFAEATVYVPDGED